MTLRASARRSTRLTGITCDMTRATLDALRDAPGDDDQGDCMSWLSAAQFG